MLKLDFNPVTAFFQSKFGRTLLLCFTAIALSSAPIADSKAREALGILRAECFSCHGEKQKGGFSFKTRDLLLKGGDEGVVVVAGKPESSRLLRLLEPGADPHMPPKKQLAPPQIRAVRHWIRAGVPWEASALEEDAVKLEAVRLEALPPSYGPVLAVALSPDGTRLAVGRGGTLILHDLSKPTFPILAQVTAQEDAIQSLAWSLEGRMIASGSFRSVVFWDGETLRREGTMTNGLSGRITALEFAPGGGVLALADGGEGRGGQVRFIEVAGRRVTASWRVHSDTVFDLEYSRDGTRLLTAGGDQLVKVWEVATGQTIAVLEGHTAQVLSAVFNTNATQVLSGGADRQLKVWNVATREKIAQLGSPATSVSAVAWPGAGLRLYSANEGGEVFQYSQLKSHSGEQSSGTADERRLAEGGEAAYCLAVSADGGRVCAGFYDGSVRIWDGESKLIATLVDSSPKAAVVATQGLGSIRGKSPKAGAKVDAIPLQRERARPATFKVSTVVKLSAEPARLSLSQGATRQGVLITAQTSDGFEVDVTDTAVFRVERGAPIRLGEQGEIVAVRSGKSLLTVRLGRHEVVIPVEVSGEGELVSNPSGFVRDILPVLSQAGCSAGSCHAKPEGQNGFKLSVFSYDPVADYGEIVKEARGRRVFPAAPDSSLLLRKPLGRVAHEGGQRFKEGSETHRVLSDWIRQGMPFALTNEPILLGITVSPAQRRYRKGAVQKLLVVARYSDGSQRDVTRLAAFDSNEREIAAVDSQARIQVGQLTGQGAVVARYMGFVGDSRIVVPAETRFPTESYAVLPTHNFIDKLAYTRFQELGILPSELCTDTEFLRRSKLDAVGQLPTALEVREFLANTDPNKRAQWIDRTLGNSAYADHWANRWADLLRPNPDRVGVKSVYLLDHWLREQFRNNVPYDSFVRSILLAEGGNHRDGPAVIYRDRREPVELTTMFSQLFLGTRLECAKCHHHPNEKWSQDDFYRFAAYFGPLKQKGAGLSPPISAGMETFYFTPGGNVKHPVTGQIVAPRPPDGPELVAGSQDPRVALADWLTAPKNPFFARAAVNRVWAHFFGRGLVHPVDDFRVTNPGVNPELLDALANDFESSHYDLKHLIRTILGSRLYQLSSTANASNVADTRNFSRSYRRRLPAEVLADAVSGVTGVVDTFEAVPTGGSANQAWSYKIQSHFLDAFGRPNSSSDCPCERELQLSVVQSLHLMNSTQIQGKLAHAEGWVRQIAKSDRPPVTLIEEVYLAALNRPPTETEQVRASAVYSAAGATRQTATEDLLWALFNSPEFIFNH